MMQTIWGKKNDCEAFKPEKISPEYLPFCSNSNILSFEGFKIGKIGFKINFPKCLTYKCPIFINRNKV